MPRRPTVEPPIYCFRVHIRGKKTVWREIEMAANQPLADLGEAIPLAFDFDDPHLWSFFLSGKAWDATTEYALSVVNAPAKSAKRALIRDVPYPGAKGDKEFLFLFDYGDEWHFIVKLVGQNPTADPNAIYPRVVAQAGKAPPQYPDLDEEEDEEDE